MTPLKNLFCQSEKPVIQGSLILQALVHYAADISNRIAEGFIKTPIDQLIKWMTNAVAARGPEECIKSTSVQKKLKRQLVDLTKEHYHTLACDKFGSRVLDVLWLAASERQQGILVEKLMTHRSMLENNFFGKFALKNFRPRHRQQQDQRENRKRSFMEILEE
jgi:nucleolar protein 9